MIKLIIENVEQLTDEIVLIPATEENLDLIIEAELFTTLYWTYKNFINDY